MGMKKDKTDERESEREKDGKVVVYLPNVEADRVHNSRLDDLHTWEHSPGDRYRLVGVTVCQVLRSLRGEEEEERERNCLNIYTPFDH